MRQATQGKPADIDANVSVAANAMQKPSGNDDSKLSAGKQKCHRTVQRQSESLLRIRWLADDYFRFER